MKLLLLKNMHKPVGLVKVVPNPTAVTIAFAGLLVFVLFEEAVAGGQYLHSVRVLPKGCFGIPTVTERCDR